MDKEMRKMIAKRAAKYFKSRDTVNLGICIPSLCCDYAEPGVMFQSENGFVGVGEIARGISISERLYNAGGVPYIPVLGGAALTSEMSFGMIRSGRMDATVLGGLQVSEKGDLSNWSTPGREFGMGGAMDLVNGAKLVIVTMEHCTKEGMPKIVKECTLPYTGRHCVDHIITELCVIDVTDAGLVLKELAPGITAEYVQERTQPELILSEDLKEMEI